MRELKYCCFRFDVDTHACVARGMPPLLEVAKALGVKFTFFVNMGRAFDRRIVAGKVLRRLRGRGVANHIPAATKLGLTDSALAAIFNPKAGSIAPRILRAAEQSGHEIGLHGGRNHAQWEHYAGTWPKEKLLGELEWGLAAMRRHGLREPVSFASPAWNSPGALAELLPPLGFEIIADTYDPGDEEIRKCGGLRSVPTNVTPGSGRAGYLETLRLAGMTRDGIVAHFKEQLAARSRLAVVYDHPFYAGVHALQEVRDLVEAALECGFNVCTIRDAVAGLDARVEQPERARL